MGRDGRVATLRTPNHVLRASSTLHLVCSVVGLLAACRGAAPAHDAAPVPTPQAPAAKEDGGDVVLARFGERVLTRAQLEQGLAAQPPAMQAEYKTVEARQELLERTLRLELLADEARRRGLDREPEVQRRLNELLVEEMMNRLFGEKALEATPITDADLQRYYDAHVAEFHTPEERRATEIVVDDKRTAQKLQQRFSGAPASELGYFSRASTGGPVAAVREAVFGMSNVGESAPQIVEVDGRFHVVKLTGIRPAVDRSLADVSNLIRSRLRQEQRTQGIERLVSELKKRTQLQTYPERLVGAPSAAQH